MRLALALVLVAGCGSTHATATVEPDAGEHVRAHPDAGPPPEGGADAGKSFCAHRSPRAAFCDDFDDLGALGALWDVLEPAPPGVASTDLTSFVSAPASLGIVTRHLGTGELGSILLRKTVKGTASRVVFAFDYFGDEVQKDGTLAIATLDLSLDHLLTLYLRDDDPSSPGPTLTELPPLGTFVERNPLPVPPAFAWTHVEIAADTSAGHVTVRYGGAVVLDIGIAKGAAQDPTIRVGALVSGPAAPYVMRFDDVTLDLAP
jgi:hypothetical protein